MKKKFTAETVLAIAIVIAIAIVGAFLFGCTEQKMARSYGGTYTVKLPKGQRLIEATRKESNLWYLTEPMDSSYEPKTKIFKEDSNFGVWEG